MNSRVVNSSAGRRRALLSVFDKSGIVEFAGGLVELGWELISSGGTAEAISAGGIAVTDVADYTGSPIMLGHRVATLHPRLHGGILADREDPEHQEDLIANNIEVIDLVVSNLYPFRSEPGIEMIDIGGPTLMRSAAKNHEYVGVVTNPADYESILEELRANDSDLSAQTRRRLARAAFAHTAAYDAAIVGWLDSTEPEPAALPPTALPPTIHIALERAEVLRYGENPHQRGARYRSIGETSMWDQIEQYSGVPLSYLNLFDADAAWRLAQELGDLSSGCAVAIIKHANPCGAAVGPDLATAYQRAFECDPRSAFGGIVAVNRIVEVSTVAAMEAAAQADVIIAPGYADGVVERLIAKRRNTRILRVETPDTSPARPASPASVKAQISLRKITDGFLVQEAQCFASAPSQWQVVTEREPTAAETADAAFAWRVCGHVKSNAVVLARDGVAWGIGAGQQNRVEAAQIAASKADGRAQGGACASDAFYPFPDGIHAAADAGAAIIVQPGGSVNDKETIAAADERGISMVFTAERQFLH
ncbi:MAG: bifunctional phosphoribosylaminoimidazolecarboxamide formyltransferase/IMP cyclohydrolase [Acidimicrobiaceae bacterium]|nr:bifunctional phosphoribosylaminoimidazolecarboxamide formyltransferase/IMP cyclohydrolase [Acidimicrobiaceae bacterium]MXW76562.1 bifunctional phosphoribosylaminoimidazolecarboxamide formyltransferase/IMP cyclohydrolase [Acidimicrobiaceae bacterium]MYA74709.1 bifunctional phosphoribosylaminoimidazolecarboxamide formyltransferase/IMP cyclohydrolase [Acidimicrobiaceae bacterium]MYC42846.1 bifunctional phosphoribosylaminoimidazolecarboxamide formyltransferase/IMP cyclohydrolase [Acidimicrobiacea